MSSKHDEAIISLPEPWADYYIDTDPKRFDVDAAWDYLSKYAYWGRDRTRSVIEKQLTKAFMLFGLFHRSAGKSTMVGMSRVVGDGSINLLMDVYILPEHQGSGLGVAFLKIVLDRDGRDDWRWLLYTGDRKDWYLNKFDFKVIGHGSREPLMGVPYFILERDGLVVKTEREARSSST